MAKMVHMMIRVLDADRSIDFYRRGMGLEEADRVDLGGAQLIYLRNPENDFELELTVNKDRAEPYDLGDGYGHLAFVVDNLDEEHARFQREGFAPKDIKTIDRDGQMLARFFFVEDPDGYKIEMLQRHGRYQ